MVAKDKIGRKLKVGDRVAVVGTIAALRLSGPANRSATVELDTRGVPGMQLSQSVDVNAQLLKLVKKDGVKKKASTKKVAKKAGKKRTK